MISLFNSLLKIDKPKVTIMNRYFGCPYCYSEIRNDARSCCGESSTHFEYLYELNTDDIVTESELSKYEVINESDYRKTARTNR